MSTLRLSWKLANARLTSRKGEALLDLFAVIAYAASAALALTTLGGVWMFWRRMDWIEGEIADKFSLNPDWVTGFGHLFFGLAVIALALLAVPVLSVGSGAARLGANGRARRLASLRLIGMSGAQVTIMSVVESLILATIGFAAGLALYVATVPLWSNVSFNGFPIEPHEMLLPWWGFLGAFVVFLLVAAISTVLGLFKVSISPLGVARRETPKALRAWRALLIVVAVVILVLMTSKFSPFGADTVQFLTVGVLLLVVFLSISVAGPWLIQTAARLFTRTGSPSRLLAVRRVMGDPRAAWRNIASVSLMAFIATFITMTVNFAIDPDAIEGMAPEEVNFNSMMSADLVTGVLIAFAFAVVLGAVSTLIQQASDVFDRTDESVALTHIGTPPRTLHLARFQQVMGPLLVTLLLAVFIGSVPATFSTGEPLEDNLVVLGVMLAIGVVTSLAAVAATVPIQNRVLAERNRKND